MDIGWVTKRVLITVKTYPTPAYKGVEVSCTAGITDDGNWIRLFPIPFRYLDTDQRFRKYQWIEVSIKKASDHRPESYEVDIDSIKQLGDPVSTKDNWKARKDFIYPLKAHCLCCMQNQRDNNGYPTLGLIKPKFINSFKIEKDDSNWTEGQRNRLMQSSFLDKQPIQKLEKIPYRFSYTFSCDEPNCKGHTLMCTDWEIMQSYRNWSRRYGNNWETPFKQRYETEMILGKDIHFYVGTLHEHPNAWIIIGLFYPPKSN